MSAFIEGHRQRFGVEPICSTLGVSASAYYERRTGRRSTRAIEDERLLARIEEIHKANYVEGRLASLCERISIVQWGA